MKDAVKAVPDVLLTPAVNQTLIDPSPSFYRATAFNATHGIAKAFLSVRPSICQMHAL